jgi:hypothetical protein
VPHWSWCVRLGSYVLSRVGFFVFHVLSWSLVLGRVTPTLIIS